MEPFDRKQTKWEGLWWHREYNGFSSAAFSLSDLRKFNGKVRLYVRKNKFFNSGENGRPNYHFCLKDENSEVFHLLEVEDEEKSAGGLRKTSVTTMRMETGFIQVVKSDRSSTELWMM